MPLAGSLQISQRIQLLISLCLHRASEATSVQFPIFHSSGSRSKTLHTLFKSSQGPNHAFPFSQLPVPEVLVLHSLGCNIWLFTLFLIFTLALHPGTMSLDGIDLFQRVGWLRRRLEFWFCEQTSEWASIRWPQAHLYSNGVHCSVIDSFRYCWIVLRRVRNPCGERAFFLDRFPVKCSGVIILSSPSATNQPSLHSFIKGSRRRIEQLSLEQRHIGEILYFFRIHRIHPWDSSCGNDGKLSKDSLSS